MKTITYEEWVEKFHPFQNPNTKEGNYNNYFFDTLQEVKDFSMNVPEFTRNQIWTLISGENETSWIISGEHFVDRLGHFVTKISSKEYVQVDDNEYISVGEAKYKCKEFIEDILNIELTNQQEDLLHDFYASL